MDWFEVANRYYQKGYYTNENIKSFVKAEKITAEQYKLITGEDYI